ncbi:TetR/AcrR family transcriptional regulator [Sphingorhabdus buctiana]|jgi:AcrR family transcriptional regulator|uniref:TetR/AcrR family transcriptional regulator n=1 Tax=Sphingorhabdus buctiana TaxID=1508805 RepID=A0ABW4MG15_9SPHN
MTEREHGAGGARRKAILATAREMFLDQGYKPVSMSAIAARLGGSKTTLWSYFPSKPVLFMAVAEDLVDEYAEFISASLVLNQPLDRSLTVFGERLLAALTSPPITALMRIVTGEARDIPGLGQMFHEQGLARGWRITTEYFAELQRRGLLRSSADPFRAAQHFIALCQSGCYQIHMIGDQKPPNAATIAADVNEAVKVFCAAYGPQD